MSAAKVYTGHCDMCGKDFAAESLEDFILWTDFHMQCGAA